MRCPLRKTGSPVTIRPAYLLATLLGVYLALAVGYGSLNPLFEAPDEHHHFFTVVYITEQRQLPVVGDPWLRQEAAQPPLYYLLAAALIAPLRPQAAEAQAQLQFNPDARPGYPGTVNINAFVHTPAEAWPWQGYALVAHLLRWLSTGLGAGTLLTIYAAGRRWLAGRPAQDTVPLLATGLVALLPQFAFIHSTISNDPLIIFLCSLTLYQLVRLWSADTLSPRAVAGLGVSIGLAALTKNQGLALLPLALVVVLAHQACQQRWHDCRGEPMCSPPLCSLPFSRWAAVFWSSLLLSGLMAALTGWLYWRNWRLYGDPTAIAPFIALGGGDRAYTLAQLWTERGMVATSFVAAFGWQNVLAPAWVYHVWMTLALLSSLGLIGRLLQRRPLPPLGIGLGLVGWVGLVAVGWVSFALRTPAAQGRLLFPALLPLALGVAGGWYVWAQGMRLPRGLTLGAPLLAAGVTAGVCLVWVVPQAYRRPALLAPTAIPPQATPVEVEAQPGLWLRAVETTPAVIQPGDAVIVTLYWQARMPLDIAWPVHVTLVGRGGEAVGGVTAQPGRGQYPMPLWPAGRVVVDRWELVVADGMAVPTLVRPWIQVGDDGVGMWGAAVKAQPPVWPSAGGAVAEIGAGIELVSVTWTPEQGRPGQEVQVTLTWQTRAAPAADYTVFVHLLDSAGRLAAQKDSPPVGGAYPTSWWGPGERFTDRYDLTLPPDLPPGAYFWRVGLYDAAVVRQPVWVGGMLQPDAAYPAGVLHVMP